MGIQLQQNYKRANRETDLPIMSCTISGRLTNKSNATNSPEYTCVVGVYICSFPSEQRWNLLVTQNTVVTVTENIQYHTFSQASCNADIHETELNNIGCFRHLAISYFATGFQL